MTALSLLGFSVPEFLAITAIMAAATLVQMAPGRGLGLADLARAGLLVPGIVLGYWLAPLAIVHIDRHRMRLGMLTVAVAGALVLILRG